MKWKFKKEKEDFEGETTDNDEVARTKERVLMDKNQRKEICRVNRSTSTLVN